MPQSLPRYEPSRTYAWNYEHAPQRPGGLNVPEVGGRWTFCGRVVPSPLGIAAGPLLNGRWVLYYAELGFDVLTYKTTRSAHRECYPLPNLQPVESGTLAGGSAMNPYKIGLEVWLDIEERWNKGRHGLDWERCEDHERRASWDTRAMRGTEMIFRVRRAYNDVTFIDEFLTEDLCHKNQLFVYRWNPQTNRKEIATRDFQAVKQQLLRQLANGGAPVNRSCSR